MEEGVNLKKILASLTLGVTLLVPIAIVFATDEVKSGEVELNPNEVSILATEYVGGGTWQHGFSGSYVYSYYDHTGLEHRASVENYNTLERDLWRSKDYGYSRVTLPQTLWGNKAYWATR